MWMCIYICKGLPRREKRGASCIYIHIEKEGGTYPCFHTGGTSDVRYGASRPGLTALYTSIQRVKSTRE